MEIPTGLRKAMLLNHPDSPLSRTVRSANYSYQPKEKIIRVTRNKKTRVVYAPAQPAAHLDGTAPFYVSWNDQPAKRSSSKTEAHAKVII